MKATLVNTMTATNNTNKKEGTTMKHAMTKVANGTKMVGKTCLVAGIMTTGLAAGLGVGIVEGVKTTARVTRINWNGTIDKAVTVASTFLSDMSLKEIITVYGADTFKGLVRNKVLIVDKASIEDIVAEFTDEFEDFFDVDLDDEDYEVMD